MNFRPTQAVIDLSALRRNAEAVRKRLPAGCGVLAMIKADAYGHGAVPVAHALTALKTEAFGVATLEEGIELRENGIGTPILVMGGLMGGGGEAARALVAHRLTPVIHSPDPINALEAAARSSEKVKIHLKIDTGMTRMGALPSLVPKILEGVKNSPHLELEGVMTHLAYHMDVKYTKDQTERFRTMGESIQKTFGKIPVWHLANSAAVMEGEPIEGGFLGKCWARPGIMLYGIPPYPDYAGKLKLEPVMSLVSKVVLIKTIPSGTKVSYSCTFETRRKSRIALVPVGYADGYPWAVSNRGAVLIAGKRCPVLGRVTMDMTMVDLTDCEEARIGSDVVLMGRQGDQTISADELAEWAGTIAYEIVCRVSKRMPREYLS